MIGASERRGVLSDTVAYRQTTPASGDFAPPTGGNARKGSQHDAQKQLFVNRWIVAMNRVKYLEFLVTDPEDF
jgi:hypothetical protein